MKTQTIKYLLLIVCGLALGTMCSCQLEPEPIPQEELFLREFIKQYGLIDPQQDWNMAEREHVTIETGDMGAGMIKVYVRFADRFYRVAAYADVVGSVTIPIDVPDSTRELYVDVDGVVYVTNIGGTINTQASSRAESRTVSGITFFDSYGEGYQIWDIPTTRTIDFMRWGTNKAVYRKNDTDTKYVTVTPNSLQNTYVGAEFIMELYTKPTYPVPYVFTFESSTAVNTTLDIAIIDQDANYYLNETVNIKPQITDSNYDLTSSNKQTHTFVTSALPPHKYYNLYIKVSSSSNGSVSAGTIGNFKVDAFKGSDMAWLLVAEDLGATDDFDFNDVIMSIQSLSVNEAFLKLTDRHWQVVEDEEHIVFTAPKRQQSRAQNAYTQLRVKALSAGGILDSYLHFRVDQNNDYLIYPTEGVWDLVGAGDKPVKSTDPGASDDYEWHKWFNEGHPSAMVNQRNMLWTGLNDGITTKEAMLIVPDGFSMAKYSQIFSDEDGQRDHIGDNGSTGSDLYDDQSHKVSAWNYAENCEIKGFYLTVGTPTGKDDDGNTAYYLGASRPGGAPQMFLIPDVGTISGGNQGDSYWHWPSERVPIMRVYPRFSEWVNNHLASDWYLDVPVNEQVYNKEGDYRIKTYISFDR